MQQDNEEPINGVEAASKRFRYGLNTNLTPSAQVNSSSQDSASKNGVSSNAPLLDNGLTPVEQMIGMIAALLAEGERGAESLEILVSNIHPDLLADIVITNMRHLAKTPPPLTRLGGLPVSRPIGTLSDPAQAVSVSSPVNNMHTPVHNGQTQPPLHPASAVSSSLSDTSNVNNSAADSRRDPRRVRTSLHDIIIGFRCILILCIECLVT